MVAEGLVEGKEGRRGGGDREVGGMERWEGWRGRRVGRDRRDGEVEEMERGRDGEM